MTLHFAVLTCFSFPAAEVLVDPSRCAKITFGNFGLSIPVTPEVLSPSHLDRELPSDSHATNGIPNTPSALDTSRSTGPSYPYAIDETRDRKVFGSSRDTECARQRGSGGNALET